MPSKIDISDHVYGRITVINESKTRINNKVTWDCECKCGKKLKLTTHQLRSDNVKSCGCLRKDNARKVGRNNRIGRGENGLNSLYLKYKSNANKKNIDFNIDIDTFALLTKCPCYYCGALPSQEIVPTSKTKEGSEYSKYIYNGIDRVNSNVGYVENNLLPCCKKCNYAKRKMTVPEFKGWIKTIYNNLIGRKNVSN